MKVQEKVAYLFEEIVQLPEHAQAEIIEAIIAMRCAHLGIVPADEFEAPHITS